MSIVKDHDMDGTGRHSAGSSRFRHRKISVKQHLRIYRPTDLKNLDKQELQQRDVVDVETGVEKNEEKEVHLHRILQKGASQINGKAKEYIPTPDVLPDWPEFDKFYSNHFHEPSTYIKFSATVEDCCGSNYSMDEKDEIFLEEQFNKQLIEDNSKTTTKLSEDEFEILCSAFENAIQDRQPFLSIDPESILSFDEIKPTLLKIDLGEYGLRSSLAKQLNYTDGKRFLTQFDPESQIMARPLINLIDLYGSQIYDYWKIRKIESNGSNIFPTLKFERPGEKEEIDPYVCFRRREVRHPRKTRRIDIINCQKLRSLHKELKRAKELALLVAQREQTSSLLLKKDSDVFVDRIKIKNLKRKLNIRGDEDDLINHRKKQVTVMTIERRRQIEEEEILAAQLAKEKAATEAAELAQAKAAATAATATATSIGNKKLSSKNRALKKHLEQLLKSGEKLTKQQIQQLQQLQRGKSDISSKNLKKEEALLQQQQQQKLLLLQQQQQQQQHQQLLLQQQQSPSISSHVYVKLPFSKIPDIELDDVDKLLSEKEKNAKRFVQERMEKRKLEDGNTFFNLTDDPYNPVFEMNLPEKINSSESAFSSIASSKFVIDKSFFLPNLEKFMNGTSDEVKIFDKNGDRISDILNKELKKVELYNPFDAQKELHSREYPVKFRRRIGRAGIQYLDRKPNMSCAEVANEESMLNEFIDFDAVDKEDNDSDATIDVYDSQSDQLTRFYDKWKYDSPKTGDYGTPFSNEPSRLNKLSNNTQVIRFGTMLGSKSYDQLRKSTMRYRRDYINRIRQQRVLQQQLQQQQQQLLQQQQQQQQLQQPQSQQPQNNQTTNQESKPKKKNNKSPSKNSSTKTTSDHIIKHENIDTAPSTPIPSQSSSVPQQTSS